MGKKNQARARLAQTALLLSGGGGGGRHFFDAGIFLQDLGPTGYRREEEEEDGRYRRDDCFIRLHYGDDLGRCSFSVQRAKYGVADGDEKGPGCR